MLQILSVVFYVCAAICSVAFMTSIGTDTELAGFLLPLYGGAAFTALFFGGVCGTLHSIDTSLKSIAQNTSGSKRVADGQADNYRSAEVQSGDTRTDNAASAPLDDQALMERFGITSDGDQFFYKTFRYSKLSDAISYATLEERRNGR